MIGDTISKERFEELFQKYLKSKGPNPGTGFFGKWGWYAKQKSFFKKYLKDIGIKIK